MNLKIPVTFAPMEADTAAAIPTGPEWEYEPKWDGFRCLAFRDGAEVALMSKSGEPLGRYFPEVVTHLLALEAEKFVVDGELVIVRDNASDFDALLQRIHPADSRVKKLAQETPATFILFDMLLDAKGQDLTTMPLPDRRNHLESFYNANGDGALLRLSPCTPDLKVAEKWFSEMRGTLDGVIAKRTDIAYDPGARHGMLKIKNLLTADCVIGGFRYGKSGGVGSLLLGLYDTSGLLHHVGFTSGITAQQKKDLKVKLEPLIEEPGFTGAKPGGPSRWSTAESAEWKPLASKLVVEIQYDHYSGHRFRHGTRLLRWRPDKDPKQCKMEQVAHEAISPLLLLK